MTTPSQQYVYVSSPQNAGSQSRTGGSGTSGQQGSGSRNTQQSRTNPQQQQQKQEQQVKLPKGVPRAFGNRQTVFYAWFAAMILICFDEWHNYHWLPRPSRLWYTSLTYGLLLMAGFVDALVPLVNVIAIGFTIMLLWQYYNGSGQFSSTSGSATS